MPELLTESFCERCGTRYTFESVAPRKTKKLGQFKTLGKGVKNWVMSDDSSLDEAMAIARSDEEREVTSQQLEAFHSTFNFCMSCRQYTCANCWNAADGQCLSCAPLGEDAFVSPVLEMPAAEPTRFVPEAWPEADLAKGVAAEAAIDALPGNGAAIENGAHAGANGFVHDEPEAFDAAARLAFLAGDAPGPAAEPEAPAASGAELERQVAKPEAQVAEHKAQVAEHEAQVAEPDSPVVAPAVDEVRAEPAERIGAAEKAPETVGAPEPVGTAPAEVAKPAVEEPAAAVAATAYPETQELSAEVAEPLALGIVDTPAPASSEPPMPDDVTGRAAAGAARTSNLLAKFRPGQNIDAELAAFEAELDEADKIAGETATLDDTDLLPGVPAVSAEADIAAEAAAAEVVEAAVPVEPGPEPVAAAAPEAEPIGAAVVPAPAAEPEPAVAAEPAPVAHEAAIEPEPVAAAAAEPAAVDLEPVAAAIAAVAAVTADPEPVATAEAEVDLVAAAEPQPESVDTVEPEPIAAIAEPEPVAAALEPEHEPEPVATALEPEPVAATVDPEPVAEPVPAAEPEPAPIAASAEPQPAPEPVREDVIEQPTWRIFAPDQAATPAQLPKRPVTPAQPEVQASAEPQWPTHPEEASPAMALLSDPKRATSDALWAASAQAVLASAPQGVAAPIAGVQPCSNCGLSLSANARFCRRCGTRQG
ncbi:MAG TPA: zinc-ribbon domain-containing protein [Candidatus Limnocylindrales bacterium]